MMTGQIITNRFEINDLEKDLLGQGGMGDVYRGVDTQTGQTVAIKVLKPDVIARNPDIVTRFIREGKALRQLKHPNIVEMVAAVEEDGQHYLVMEYVGGGSLEDLLEEQGRLPVSRAAEISLDLADALTRAHRLDIIHRDLKPANVLLAEDGTPRLTDFGIAHIADSPRLTQTGMLIGTVDYLSPEACQGETLDGRVDIWAFGVMMYEMLTGERPFTGKIVTAVITSILIQPVPDLSMFSPDLPDALVDLIYRMLKKDRIQRIPSVRLVGAELEAILHEREITPSSPRPASSVTGRFATTTPSTDTTKYNLPTQPTSFVGREAELTELARLLTGADICLLTILGVGGMGKTRLALEAGMAQLGNFEHGVFFVSLAPLQLVDSIVSAVAEAVGFSFYPGVEPRQQLLNYLRQKQMLIIMDNFEHLLDGVDLVTGVLETAPDVKILATTRVRLNVQREHLFHLAGMDFPDWETPEDAAQYSAVKLFMQSARRVRPDFELKVDNLKYISRICRLAGGMPLGILLAAAWVEMLSPKEIATEIGQGIDFLETDLRDIPERQRGVRAVFDYSFNLLTEREREVFLALSVFRGGFTRQAAQQVTGALLRELMGLVNKSLLYRASTGRYQVHELLRQYAQETLDQDATASTAMHDRHCTHYAAALQQWGKDMKGSRQQTTLAEMEVEIENVRAAWDWAVERGQMKRLDQAVWGLSEFYLWSSRWQDGESVFRTVANKLANKDMAGTMSGEGLRVWAKVLSWQGDFNRSLYHRNTAHQLLQKSLALLERVELAGQDTRAERAWALWRMGVIVWNYDREEAYRLHKQSLTLFQMLNDHSGIARVLFSLGSLAYSSGNYDEAKQKCRESLDIYQSLGNRWMTTYVLGMLGSITLYQGQLKEGERLIRESLDIVKKTGNQNDIAVALRILGEALWLRGEFSEARSTLEESLTLYTNLEWRMGMLIANEFLSSVKRHQGMYEQARDHGQLTLTLAREIDEQTGVGYALFMLGNVKLAEQAYADAQQLLQESATIFQNVGQRDELGWALAVLGYTVHRLGQSSRAQQYLYQALRTATEIGAFVPLMFVLPMTALFLADQNEKERAVELYALASCYSFVSNSRWFDDVAGKHIAAVAATLPPDVVAAAQERGRARDMDATVAELLVELKDQNNV
ncbi:MAG: protein kinase [Chloroflexi bacterium]|nr:protein kinase [Chloroflexota bacterium]